MEKKYQDGFPYSKWDKLMIKVIIGLNLLSGAMLDYAVHFTYTTTFSFLRLETTSITRN
jgi:hypothetical protein